MMITAKEFYSRITAMQQLPDARRQWSGYRRQLTDYIINASEPGTSLAVAGAGECNDIDIERLQKHFSKITLIDRRETEMSNKMDTYKLIDMLGLDDEAYIRFAEAVLDCRALPEGMAAALHRLYEDISIRSIGSYDYILAAGLHSQLNIIPAAICMTAARTFGTDPKEALAVIMGMNRELIPAVDDMLLSCAGSGLIAAVETGGVEGAEQAAEDLMRRGAVNVTEMDWPFDSSQGVSYRMKVMTVGTDGGKHAGNSAS